MAQQRPPMRKHTYGVFPLVCYFIFRMQNKTAEVKDNNNVVDKQT